MLDYFSIKPISKDTYALLENKLKGPVRMACGEGAEKFGELARVPWFPNYPQLIREVRGHDNLRYLKIFNGKDWDPVPRSDLREGNLAGIVGRISPGLHTSNGDYLQLHYHNWRKPKSRTTVVSMRQQGKLQGSGMTYPVWVSLAWGGQEFIGVRGKPRFRRLAALVSDSTEYVKARPSSRR